MASPTKSHLGSIQALLDLIKLRQFLLYGIHNKGIKCLIPVPPGKTHIDSQAKNQNNKGKHKPIKYLKTVDDHFDNEGKVYDSQ